MTSTVDAANHVTAPPREWWQRWAERRAAWWAARPTLARRWARARAIGLWVALAWVVGLWVLWPDLRAGLLAYVGALWVVVAWFFLARTKTLTWSGYLRFFAACIAWSYAVGVGLTVLTTVVAGQQPSNAGVSIAVAGIAEECLKLVPIVVLALAAPRRTTRFAAVDWALLGIASGTAFLVVEESARRVAFWVTDGLWTVIDRAWLDPGQVPDGWRTFRLWPIPTSWTEHGSAFGGHAIMTAIVTGLLGLAVVAWRVVRAQGPLRRSSVRLLATAAPIIALAVAIGDHAANNAHVQYALVTIRSDTPRWLDPEWTTVPWWLRGPWSALGHGQGRQWVFLAVVTACLLLDAARLATRPGGNLLHRPAPAWIHGARTRVARALNRAPRALATTVAQAAEAVATLAWITGRDLLEQVVAHARVDGEPRRSALARGAAIASAQRAVRELAYESLAGRVDVRRRRWIAVGVLVALLVASLVIAPAVAADIGTSPYLLWKPGWLAGVLDNLGDWWHSLNPGQQIAVGVGIAALIALSGGSLALAFGVAGVATWGLDKAHGIATFTRDPEQATTDYLLTATPGQLAADTVGVALTFAPGNFAGGAAARGLRTVADEIAADPAAWLARRRWALAGDTGEVQIGTLLGARTTPDGAAALAAQREAISKVFRTFPKGADDTTKAAWYREAAKADELPDHMRPILEGKAFHHEVYGHFDAHEVTINQLGPNGQALQQFRVDGLTNGEIISVKHTQLAEIHPDTARRHINEMLQKYNPNRKDLVIAPTAGNESKVAADLLGEPLRGQMILGIPAQRAPVPEWFIDFAIDRGVIIRELTPHTLPGGT